MVAKRTSMLDKQNSKCLSSNDCTFGRGFTLISVQTCKHCLTNISNLACQACLWVWPPRQTLVDKHTCLPEFQKHFLFVTSKKCFVKHMFVWWPNRPTLCLTSKTSNVHQTMLVLLAEDLLSFSSVLCLLWVLSLRKTSFCSMLKFHPVFWGYVEYKTVLRYFFYSGKEFADRITFFANKKMKRVLLKYDQLYTRLTNWFKQNKTLRTFYSG